MEKQMLLSAIIPSKMDGMSNHLASKALAIWLANTRKNSFFLVVILSLIVLPSVIGNLAGNHVGGDLYAQESAIFNASNPNKGILIPRVSLTSATDVVTVPMPVVSLLLYNTATAGVSPNDVAPGFYYWNGTKWVSLNGARAFVETFAEFFALMPGDNTATVAAGTAVEFPQDGSSNGVISRVNAGTFTLSAIGTYMVNWQVSISEPGQLVLLVNGLEKANSLVGRAMGTTQIVGSTMLTTTVVNTTISVINPVGSPTALTVTPIAGGTKPVSASLLITRIQ
jgi:hypothetical protein